MLSIRSGSAELTQTRPLFATPPKRERRRGGGGSDKHRQTDRQAVRQREEVAIYFNDSFSDRLARFFTSITDETERTQPRLSVDCGK